MLEKQTHAQIVNEVALVEYETEKLDYILEKFYLIDFKINGDYYIEVKGRLTQQDRAKYLAVKKAHPDIDLRFVFGANNKIGVNPNFRYLDWAKKHGFQAVIKKVPREWLTKKLKQK
tara:strand:+ start:471 stop:821 length:351 start_codon:yes stop_codon:yes gene_type:complete